jgi:hypothetical protein
VLLAGAGTLAVVGLVAAGLQLALLGLLAHRFGLAVGISVIVRKGDKVPDR